MGRYFDTQKEAARIRERINVSTDIEIPPGSPCNCAMCAGLSDEQRRLNEAFRRALDVSARRIALRNAFPSNRNEVGQVVPLRGEAWNEQ